MFSKARERDSAKRSGRMDCAELGGCADWESITPLTGGHPPLPMRWGPITRRPIMPTNGKLVLASILAVTFVVLTSMSGVRAADDDLIPKQFSKEQRGKIEQ